MRSAFDAQLRGLLERITEMGGLAEHMLDLAIRGLLDCDTAALDEVERDEERVNKLHTAIDERAIQLTATQQPVARDVRMVFVAVRCSADVERVGDQACNIAGSVRHLLAEPAKADVPPQIYEMATLARTALTDALVAMVTRDVALAQTVLKNEPAIDRLRDDAFKALLHAMMFSPEVSSSALSLVFISRSLERIGDHATNIAEELIYLVRGKDVRHGGA